MLNRRLGQTGIILTNSNIFIHNIQYEFDKKKKKKHKLVVNYWLNNANVNIFQT